MDQHRNPNHRSIHRSRHLHRRHLNGCEARYSDILLHPLSFHLRRIIQHRNQKFHCTLVTTLDTSNHHHHCKSYNLLQFHLPNNQFHCHKRQLQKLYLYHIHKFIRIIIYLSSVIISITIIIVSISINPVKVFIFVTWATSSTCLV